MEIFSGWLGELKESGNLQKSVRKSEKEKREAGLENYDDHHVRQAIVHAREDIILLYPLISHINRRLNIGSSYLSVGKMMSLPRLFSLSREGQIKRNFYFFGGCINLDYTTPFYMDLWM